MKYDLKVIFGVAAPYHFLMAGEKGLCVELERPLELTSLWEDNKSSFKSLWDLVQGHGFVVLRNGWLNALGGEVTHGMDDFGNEAQDLFHFDSLDDTGPFITALHKPSSAGRENTPTYYAEINAVRAAMVSVSTKGYPFEVNKAVQKMRKANYGFSLSGRDLSLRDKVQDSFPEFTERVFNLIPLDQKYAKQWKFGQLECVFHSNCAGILHGRPASDEDSLAVRASGFDPEGHECL